ncbi:MAG: hypothetical protein KAT58_01615 [candidate division Zixibacteria bacterium]|nr:hypothetical protein [candidate division Zixibacteria bacterium]
MNPERFRLLAAVIAAHPEGQVIGRTRLQKTVKLLQRLDLPTDYDYMLHFYGPYSEGLQAEVGLLELLGLVEESEQHAQDGRPYYVITSKPGAELEDIKAKFGHAVQMMVETDRVVLEIAATYDAFRESGMTHEQALAAVRHKKAAKCKNRNDDKALDLLKTLNLPSS